ncbi:MAG: hypothetical protein QGF59_18540 [Pirellulaceae bacterium]|jgi:hypothetical protein|nr:hypothetical protein [Pirellulaceae bacterium]MDP6720668.1 hypothetical protein [Pirellulaceae bacterium]
MDLRCFVAVSCAIFAVGNIVFLPPIEDGSRPGKIAERELRVELLARMKIDQDARFKMIKWAQENDISLGSKSAVLNLSAPVITDLLKIDKENRKWLDEVIKEHGWPGRSLVGVDGSHAAWLLVQHADHDRQFQKRCLTLMQEAAEGEVASVDIAYLVDRVRVGEGKKQLYGTQTKQVDGRWIVQDVEDPDNLDTRRKKMGMPPIDQYLKLIEQVYSQQKEQTDVKNRPLNKKPKR